MEKTVSKSRLPVGIGVGLSVALLLSLIQAMGAAWLMNTERVGEDAISWMSTVITASAALAGCWAAVCAAGEKRMQVSLLTGASYYLSMLAMTALFFDGEFQGLLLPAGEVAAACLLVGFLSAKQKKSSNVRRLKRAYR